MSLFARNRDDRRRRALAEESAAESASVPSVAPKSASAPAQRYTPAAKRENHRHTIDFIPRGMLKLALWYLAGLAIVGGLVFGYAKGASESVVASGFAAMLDASQGGSLAGWCSSMAFALAAAGCVVIYSVRRHKVDDYRGRYRLWLWCAMALVAMSIDATANLHTPLSRVMARVSGWSALPDGAIWWIMIGGSILAILGLRLMFEMRECRSAVTAIVAVTALWLAALAIDYGWLTIRDHSSSIAIACRLAGQATLLLSIALYARHVVLDSEGLIKQREPKPKKQKPPKKSKAIAASEDSDEESTTRVDSAHKSGSPRTDLQSSPARSSGGGLSGYVSNRSGNRYEEEDEEGDRRQNRRSNYDDEEEDDDSYGGNRKLSKAERKKIRKQMRRQEREDEE